MVLGKGVLAFQQAEWDGGKEGRLFLGGMNNAENGMKKWDVSFNGHLLGI